MKLLLQKPLLFLFLSVHLIVLVVGADIKFWPVHCYPMFSRIDNIISQPLYKLKVATMDQEWLSWSESKQYLQPFDTPYSMSLAIVSKEKSQICDYLQSILLKNKNLKMVKIIKENYLTNAEITYLEVKQGRDCAS